MPATEIETARLDLDGNFAAKADEMAGSASKAATALERMGAASQKVKAPPGFGGDALGLGKLGDQVANFNAPAEKMRMIMEQKLKSMRSDLAKSLEPPKAPTANGAWANGRPTGEMEGLAGKSAMMGAAAGGAVGIAVAGLTKIADLAERAAVKVFDVAKAFTEMGIAETSKHEMQTAVFQKLGGDYEVAIKLAGKYGIDADVAVTEVKRLLRAKFAAAEVQELVRVSVGIGAVEGEGKAASFMEKMATEANKGGKAKEKDIKGFAESGIDVEKVWKNLAAKLGVSVETAKAKVKAGTVDMKDALDSVKKAAEQDFGGIADKIGNSVPALLMRVKLGIAQLFSGFDLTPMKNALKNAADLLEGPDGKVLKDEFSKTGSEIIKALFGPFEGAEGKLALKGIAAETIALLRLLREAAQAAGVAFKFLVDQMKADKGQSLAGIIKGQRKPHEEIAGPHDQGELLGKVFGKATAANDNAGAVGKMFGKVGPAANDSLSRSLDFASIFDDTKGKGAMVGNAVVDGLAEQIQNNPDAIGAAAQMAEQILATLQQRLDVHSPSRKAGWLGSMFGKGFAKGTQGESANVEGAGRAIADSAADGASGGGEGAGGGGGAGGPSGGGAVTIIVQVQAAPGASPQDVGDQAGEAAFRAFQRHQRRDARERAA